MKNKDKKIEQGKYNIIDALILVFVLLLVVIFITFLMSDKYTGPDILIHITDTNEATKENIMVNVRLDFSCEFEDENTKDATQFNSMSDLPEGYGLIAGNTTQIKCGDKLLDAKIVQVIENNGECKEKETEVTNTVTPDEPNAVNEEGDAKKTFSYSSECYLVLEFTCETKDGINFYIHGVDVEIDGALTIAINGAYQDVTCVSIVKGEHND